MDFELILKVQADFLFHFFFLFGKSSLYSVTSDNVIYFWKAEFELFTMLLFLRSLLLLFCILTATENLVSISDSGILGFSRARYDRHYQATEGGQKSNV